MRIAVPTCQKYADCWEPFRALFAKFWPDCPYPMELHSANVGVPWCFAVAQLAEESDEPLLLMQEDFFLSAPVQTELVRHGLEQLIAQGAGCVRLYPCPGGIEDYGDPYFAIVPRGAPVRISCQAAIWDAGFLRDVAYGATTTTAEAGDFENLGTPYAERLDAAVLAFKRDVKPWPIEYLSSAITRGEWNPDALALCAQHHIPVDRSMRPLVGYSRSRKIPR